MQGVLCTKKEGEKGLQCWYDNDLVPGKEVERETIMSIEDVRRVLYGYRIE